MTVNTQGRVMALGRVLQRYVTDVVARLIPAKLHPPQACDKVQRPFFSPFKWTMLCYYRVMRYFTQCKKI